MNINVIGLGVVGKAQKFLLEKLGHQVYSYDSYVLPSSELCIGADVSFICTPEKAVDEAIKNLIEDEVEGLYVVKSTVPVGETRRLMEKYHIHICHNPEFLREKHSLYDIVHQHRILIGACCEVHVKLLERTYYPLTKPPFNSKNDNIIHIAKPEETELAKILSNSLRATVITFWNEVDQLCGKLQLSPETIAELVNQNKNLSEWEGGNWGTRFFGKPFDGKCLPKDLNHLIDAFRDNGLNPKLFEATKKFNEDLKKKDVK